MSDIFISYARSDRVLAEALANDLKAQGYRVWWDAELVGSDDFYEVILQALKCAKAVIVIWTEASTKSRFVRDEARFALHLQKLIATKETKLDTFDIPFGFQGQHTDDVTNRDNVLRAIDKLGAKPMAAGAAPIGVSDWNKLKSDGSIEDIVAYLGTNPPEPQRQAAATRLMELSATTGVGNRSSIAVRKLTVSSWQAFLQGLTFRLPKFQLLKQGTSASVGLALALAFVYVALMIAAFFAIELFRDRLLLVFKFFTWEIIWLANSAVAALVAFVAWLHLGVMARQRNFVASCILASLYVMAGSAACLLAAVNGGHLLFPGKYLGEMAREGGGAGLLGLTVGIAGALLILSSAVWRIRRAR